MQLYTLIETPEGTEMAISSLVRLIDSLAAKEQVITADQRERLMAAKEALEPVPAPFAHG
jgi:hypothetical protein